jgi:hypothetical protein
MILADTTYVGECSWPQSSAVSRDGGKCCVLFVRNKQCCDAEPGWQHQETDRALAKKDAPRVEICGNLRQAGHFPAISAGELVTIAGPQLVDQPPRAPDLAPQRERSLELDTDLRPCLRAPARAQYHAQDAVDTAPGVPEAGVGAQVLVRLVLHERLRSAESRARSAVDSSARLGGSPFDNTFVLVHLQRSFGCIEDDEHIVPGVCHYSTAAYRNLEGPPEDLASG